MMISKKKREYKGEEVEKRGKRGIFTVLGGKNIIFEKRRGAKIS